MKKKLTNEEKTRYYKDFIVVWQRAKTLPEVTKRFSITKSSASLLAHKMRKNGVNLKLFPKKQFSWGEIRSFAKTVHPVS